MQLGAVLNGDHAKDIYPDKLVEGMTVAEAAKYCNDAFKRFLEECENCRKNGADGSHIVVVKPTNDEPPPKKKTSFASKMFACFTCSRA